MPNLMQKQRARRQAAAAMAKAPMMAPPGRPPLSAPGTVGGGTEYNPGRQTFANGGRVEESKKHEAGESKAVERKEEEIVNPRTSKGKKGAGYRQVTEKFADGGAVARGPSDTHQKLAGGHPGKPPKFRQAMANGGKVPGTSTKPAGIAGLQNAGSKPGYKQSTQKFADGGVVDGASVGKIAKTKRTTKAPVGEIDSNNAKMARQP